MRAALTYWAYQYRRTWRSSIATSFLVPVMFLAALGTGLGSLVRSVPLHAGPGTAAGALASTSHAGSISYAAFLAPGLLAAGAMQTAAGEASYPVLGAIKWNRAYRAMLASPLTVTDVVLGHLAWIGLRVLVTSIAFVAVMAAFGLVTSPLVVAAIPVAALTGLAFGAPIAAFAAGRETDASFSVVFRIVVAPMFMFSGTFFPISELPQALRLVAYMSPLWHGVRLCRALSLGRLPGLSTAVDLSYLALLALGGYLAALRVYTRRLAA